jgi:hypothetical protein
MKILLQNIKTGQFLEQSDHWTKTFEAAQDFGNTEKALKFATTHKLSHVQVVAAFPSAGYVDIVGYPVPLPASVASVRRSRAVLKNWNTLPTPLPA